MPILYLHRWQTAAKRLGLIPHDRPVGHLFVVLPAFCPQIAPIEPFLPVMPVHKYRAVYNLRFESFHGMEEVIGSIPIRSTNYLNNLAEPLPEVTTWITCSTVKAATTS